MRFVTSIKIKIKMLLDKNFKFDYLSEHGYYHDMPDEEYLRKKFEVRMGKVLDLDNPKTFCEKLQWLKLYDRRPEYTMMVDKYEVKKWVAETIGEEYVIPTYGVWDSFDEIDFEKLPEEFVLKCTHDSGGVAVCKKRNGIDYKKLKKRFDKELKFSEYWAGREWPYKDIKPRILAEKYLKEIGHRDSVEYKLTCFNGRVRNITVCTGIAHSSLDVRTNDNFDRDWHYLPWYAFYKNTGREIEKPEKMDEMISVFEQLASGIPQVRVDGYIIDGNVLFGEMTFFTWDGFIKFTPPEWDLIMGEWINLPPKPQ